jgi:hypothetical protein
VKPFKEILIDNAPYYGDIDMGKTFMVRVLFFLVMFLQSNALLATTQKPRELGSLIESRHPYGEAKLRKFLWDIYDISLWTDADVWSPNEPYAITVHYLMSFTSDQLVDKIIDELNRLGSPFNAESYRKKLQGLLPNVREGDRITAYFRPASNVTFFFNGLKRGSVSNGNFAKYFSNIWLSPETEEPETREALLNKKY